MKKNHQINYFMRLIKLILPVIVLFSLQEKITGQDTTRAAKDTARAAKDTTNLVNQLENETGQNKTVYTTSTFRYTRIINGHSVENLPARVLDVRISHRFGALKDGIYQFFGLDNGIFNVRVGFDYGITNNFMIGGGHNAWQKTYDAFFKLKILRQSTGNINMPVTVSFVPTFAVNTLKARDIDPGDKPDPDAKSDGLSYVFQLLIGRKFSEGFSLQLMPTFIHADNISYNHFKDNIYKRDLFAIGIAGREKISKRMSINAEYYYQLPGSKASKAHNVLSFGLEIGTGGHVFELLFTNSIGLTEKAFIAETTGRWDNGDELFGFNISRVFQLGKKHKGGSTDWKKQ